MENICSLLSSRRQLVLRILCLASSRDRSNFSQRRRLVDDCVVRNLRLARVVSLPLLIERGSRLDMDMMGKPRYPIVPLWEAYDVRVIWLGLNGILFHLDRIQGEHDIDFTTNDTMSAIPSYQLSENKYGQWPPSRETSTYIYTAISILLVIVTVARSFFFVHMCGRSSQNLHDTMFNSITHAKIRFFHTNPSGNLFVFPIL